jgi:dTMP kinase
VARGKFITLEGGEGAGKSTQAGLLVAALQRAGIAVEQTREPGGTTFAEALRSVLVGSASEGVHPTAEALAHYSARADHLARRIEPALAQGRWVVCDRFADSTMAYQGIAGQLGRDRVTDIRQAAIGAFQPDLTLILDIPVELGLARARDVNRYELKSEEFHNAIRGAFLSIARAEPDRCIVFDASADISTVARQIALVVEDRFGLAL